MPTREPSLVEDVLHREPTEIDSRVIRKKTLVFQLDTLW